MSRPATSVVSATAALATALPAAAGEWEVDPTHTTAGFAVRHLMVSTVRGRFGKLSGKVILDEKDLTRSLIEVQIDTASIDTGEPKRDEHLRSPDFFDAAKFPKITFKSTRIEKAGEGYKVTGDLTMRGLTRPVTLSVDTLTPETKSPFGKRVRGVTAHGKLNRKDWGLTWNMPIEGGGFVVSDEVALQIDAELVAREPAASK